MQAYNNNDIIYTLKPKLVLCQEVCTIPYSIKTWHAT